jgi:hypothetical protein
LGRTSTHETVGQFGQTDSGKRAWSESLRVGAPKGRKRAASARLAQPEASECEAVGLGKQEEIASPGGATLYGPRPAKWVYLFLQTLLLPTAQVILLSVFMRFTQIILGLGLVILTSCEQPKPASQEPITCAPKCGIGTVVSHQSLEPEVSYNQFRKQNGLWQQYQMKLDTSTGVRLSLSCGQWKFPDIPDSCGQQLQPNERVWTREGARAESIWVYTNAPQEATLWVIKAKEAK